MSNLSLTAKILIWSGIILVLGALSFMIYNQINISKQQQAIQQQVIQQKTLIDGIVSSSNSYTTKQDLSNFIQQNTDAFKAIQDNLNQLGAQITAANTVTANSQAQAANNLPSTHVGQANPNVSAPLTVACPSGGSVTCPSNDPYGFQHAEQDLDLNEDFPKLQVPFGSVGFSAWQQNPWSVNIKSREYNVTSVIGTDENQRIYVDNQFTVKVNGKTYDIPIASAQTKQVFPTPHVSFWNPQVFLGMDAGLSLNRFPTVQGEFTPSLNLGIMSYGSIKTQPTFSVLQVGVGYGVTTNKPMFSITPVAANLGQILPLVHNTYIAPSFQVSTDGSVYGMLGLRLGL